MIANVSFRRKVTYGLLIAVLLIPLYMISRPAVRSQGTLTKGGILAQLRTEHNLSQADLGEIDPASESMKLATLGMRGIAANLLWERANRYKREQDWDNLTATLNQISKLQPNFISVWQYQGWNLAYNVSVEFDDYRSRYLWVKRGINLLREGFRYNSKEPVLTWELGWTFGHKLGRADEYVQYRRLYREDRAFHDELRTNLDMDQTLGPDGKPDNWLTGRQWFLRGEQLVNEGIPIRGRLVDDSDRVRRGKSHLLFFSQAPKWLISHAVAIEEEGYLDEAAQFAWMKAGSEWGKYGMSPIPTTYGFTIRLEDMERMEQESEAFGKQLDELLPGVRAEIENEKRATLDQDERDAMEIPEAQRTEEQRMLALAATRKTRARYEEMAERAPADLKRQVEKLVKQGEEKRSIADAIYNYRDQVNYSYWKLRCEVEQTKNATDGRKYVFEAKQALEATRLEEAKEKYELAWDRWAEIFDKYPEMMEDTTAEDLVEDVGNYMRVLNQLDLPFPPPGFKLTKLIELHQEALRGEE